MHRTTREVERHQTAQRQAGLAVLHWRSGLPASALSSETPPAHALPFALAELVAEAGPVRVRVAVDVISGILARHEDLVHKLTDLLDANQTLTAIEVETICREFDGMSVFLDEQPAETRLHA